MEENKMNVDMAELNEESIKNVTGGTRQLTQQEKEKWKKVIHNAKAEGVTLEEFIRAKHPDEAHKNFFYTVWEAVV